LSVDFDWCREPGWPVPKREPVLVNPEDVKTPASPGIIPEPPRPPGITNGPRNHPGGRVP
jgi:hypothetical protein